MNRPSLVLLLVGIIIGGAALAVYLTQIPMSPTASEYGDVTVDEAKALLKANPSLVIVDVRTLEEYTSGHLEGALLIPVSELESRLDELSTEDELLIYCRTGNRSVSAVTILETHGFTKLYHMTEGITAWIQAGYPTVT